MFVTGLSQVTISFIDVMFSEHNDVDWDCAIYDRENNCYRSYKTGGVITETVYQDDGSLDKTTQEEKCYDFEPFKSIPF